ncbi:MAG: hypothetical protein EBZ07_07725, partial [Verrucomicrobia bacterium]|nr:hypothetical protein [Verrucomicrobiota bacterium]
MLSPAWLAVIVVVPLPTIVTVLPATVATPVLELVYETVSPELEVAESANGASPTSLLGKAPNVIVWLALL